MSIFGKTRLLSLPQKTVEAISSTGNSGCVKGEVGQGGGAGGGVALKNMTKASNMLPACQKYVFVFN